MASQQQRRNQPTNLPQIRALSDIFSLEFCQVIDQASHQVGTLVPYNCPSGVSLPRAASPEGGAAMDVQTVIAPCARMSSNRCFMETPCLRFGHYTECGRNVAGLMKYGRNTADQPKRDIPDASRIGFAFTEQSRNRCGKPFWQKKNPASFCRLRRVISNHDAARVSGASHLV